MNWLVTYAGAQPEEEIRRRLSEAGAETDPYAEAIPMTKEEWVIEITASADVATRLTDLPWVLAVHPQSDPSAYR
ncbi:hypothetical protein [Thalassococcus sp. S3]|uniref:hypothetical protein n=1 Tax=Thalassococcus sp. S3 TaxID=2017482 RepID=UPI0010243625|nr:hypothetical protein [Thalassococcus sp. S3]QBF33087.1 hypothetical protein CFI11_17930 [Thalassococcus sp. S3]